MSAGQVGAVPAVPRPRYGWTLAMVGTAFGPALLSMAHVVLAPSSWRRLLMQAVCFALALARMKLGMAMVASRPMMATTIMISTSVKPAVEGALIFIEFVSGIF